MMILDAHIHLYPRFETGQVRESMRKALDTGIKQTAPEEHVTLVFFLAERRGEELFESWCQNDPPQLFESQAASLVNEGSAWRITASELNASSIVIVAGRQIRTASGLEVQAVGLRPDVMNDGLAGNETVRNVMDHGFQAAIPWGVGKWFGRRGKEVKGLMDLFPELALIDTAMRPRCWPEPGLIKLAKKEGRPVWRGSDPLDRDGEERHIGRYGDLYRRDWKDDLPLKEMLEKLNKDRCIRSVGRRRTSFEVIQTFM